MVGLAHVHAVDTRPFLPRREGPGDQATVQRMCTLWFRRLNGAWVNLFAHIARKLRLAPLYALPDTTYNS